MKYTYRITGMTCGNCKATVEKSLNDLQDIKDVVVNLEKGEATISMNRRIDIAELQKALPSKYTISEKEYKNVFTSVQSSSL